MRVFQLGPMKQRHSLATRRRSVSVLLRALLATLLVKRVSLSAASVCVSVCMSVCLSFCLSAQKNEHFSSKIDETWLCVMFHCEK